jgi:hypothetical protein
MKTISHRLFKRALLAFLVMNVLFGLHNSLMLNTFSSSIKRSQRILLVKPKLEKLSSGIWGVISVFDPAKGEKVNFAEVPYKDILRDINADVEWADASTEFEKSQDKLDLLKRSLKSLTKHVMAVENELDAKKTDEEETSLFFPNVDTLTMGKTSYVDSMSKMMEKLRFIQKTIENNIAEYVEVEITYLAGKEKYLARANAVFLWLDGIFILGTVGMFFSLRGKFPQRPLP